MKQTFFLILFVISTLSISMKQGEPKLVTAQEAPITFEVATGKTSSLLLSSEHNLYAWGLWGEDGNINQSIRYATPTDIAPFIKLEEGEKISSIGSGEQTSYILTNYGNLYGFGSNQHHQLLFDTPSFATTCVKLTTSFDLAPQEQLIQIAAGANFAVALSSTHQLYTFGENDCGQLGISLTEDASKVHNITTMFPMQEGDYIDSICCGSAHTLVLSKNGHVYGFGNNDKGQLGMNPLDQICMDTPILISNTLDNAQKIACGRECSYVLTSNKDVYVFGGNSQGQLGNGKDILTRGNDLYIPYLLNSHFSLGNEEVIQDIIAGYYFTFFKSNLNNLYACGENACGQLGIGSQTNANIPTMLNYKDLLNGDERIETIAGGENHCIAISNMGRIFNWGSTLYNQALKSDGKQIQTLFTDITYYFPPIIVLSMLGSSSFQTSYQISVEAYYLDKEEIEEIYYVIDEYLTNPKGSWLPLEDIIYIKDGEGDVYLHIRIDSEKETYYYTSKAFYLDHICPTLQLVNEKNEKIETLYYNSTIFLKTQDNNENVNIYLSEDNQNFQIFTEDKITTCGHYFLYAQDAAKNQSATIEVTIDTISPMIKTIDHDIITSSYTTSNKTIHIQANEIISCYSLGYVGSDSSSLIGINKETNEWDVTLKKGVNTLVLYDLASNASIQYEIIYSPSFFADTQLLLIVFGSIVFFFLLVVIVSYLIRSKQKLLK